MKPPPIPQLDPLTITKPSRAAGVMFILSATILLAGAVTTYLFVFPYVKPLLSAAAKQRAIRPAPTTTYTITSRVVDATPSTESGTSFRDDPQWKKAEKLVNSMLKQGTLRRIEPANKRAWVDSLTWLALDAEHKELLARSLAIYCMPMYPEIDIYDGQSAKRVASYGPFQGFKVY